jgi:2-keto-4-pentenoate hydratase/2-oxohepta-3-ene-1,7-dioic acid hydratase in catechol pathway
MNVNRIFCIGRNYAAHIQELGNTPDEAFVVFMKPPSCIVPVGQELVLPRHRGSVHHEAELVVLLTGGGAEIPEAQALTHVSHITLGLDLTLRDLQNTLKNKGNPWELCKAFDHAAPLAEWKPWHGQDLQALEFTCSVNGALRQHGHTRDMLFSVARQIHILSRTWALADGDIIYTGTPAGVGPLLPGDRVELESAAIGRFQWNCV